MFMIMFLTWNLPSFFIQDCSNWVLCKVEENKGNAQSFNYSDEEDGTELSCLDEMFLSLDDDFDDISSSSKFM